MAPSQRKRPLATRRRRSLKLRKKRLQFTVDSALLRELGERLVGQPHIALAELIKNSYDADARHVRVLVENDRLIVEDDGHGMTLEEFRNFWMRIGTPHKQEDVFSRKLRRPLTGSKGVGRLAVQFLARRLSISTKSDHDANELNAEVDWNEAVTAGELTSASATYTVAPTTARYVDRYKHGTRIELHELNDLWTPTTLTELATELWNLQPPYGAQDSKDPRSFKISLESSDEEISRAFEKRIKANLDIWAARIRGRLLPADSDDPPGTRRFSCGLQFRNGESELHVFPMANCTLDNVDYDIRIFSLHYRQRYGISVEEARKYLKLYGGVHIYDAGFHLPYYGPEVDWLGTEIDHSHRLSRSDYLPKELHVVEGMNNLPTISRIYGTVNIDTASERRAAAVQERLASGRFLEIQISRDRLVDNDAYRQLISMLRTAIDLYAMRETTRRLEEARIQLNQLDVRSSDLPDLEKLLELNRERIPQDVYVSFQAGLHAVIERTTAFRQLAAAEIGLVGSLATAGINTLALEHETNKELIILESLVEDISKIRVADPATSKRLQELTEEMRAWIRRARQTRAILSPLLDEDDRAMRERLLAKVVLKTVTEQTRAFTRDIPIDIEKLDKALRLPAGSIAEWSAIFQNVFVNATNALLDSTTPQIEVSSTSSGPRRTIRVQDNGVGIDVRRSEQYFRPFARESKITPERRALGLGGTGLGLTIVRMIANALNTETHFVEPDEGFSTAFELSWTEEIP